jgi:hypothetical protein
MKSSYYVELGFSRKSGPFANPDGFCGNSFLVKTARARPFILRCTTRKKEK